MFACYTCIKNDKVKVLNKSYAMLTIEIGRGSLGSCEKCRRIRACANV